MVKLFANSGDPDQTPRSAASDLGLHGLPITLPPPPPPPPPRTHIHFYESPDYNELKEDYGVYPNVSDTFDSYRTCPNIWTTVVYSIIWWFVSKLPQWVQTV